MAVKPSSSSAVPHAGTAPNLGIMDTPEIRLRANLGWARRTYDKTEWIEFLLLLHHLKHRRRRLWTRGAPVPSPPPEPRPDSLVPLPPSAHTAMSALLVTPQDYADLLSKYTTFLFDLDGVCWSGPRGDELTPNILEAISLLRALKKRIAFVTNNATQSRERYLHKFHSLGFESVQLDEIFTCGSASAVYLRDRVLPNLPEDKRGIYVIGQEGLEHELREVGLEWKGGSDPHDHVLMPFQDFRAVVPDKSISVVLFSFQMHLNYQMLSKAYNYLATNEGCELILTNDDATVLVPDGVCPGEGAMASVLYGARKGLVPTVVGKPNQPLLDVVHSALQFDRASTIMIGDRLETDVLFGKRGGISTMLVLSGAAIAEDLIGVPEHEAPDFVAPNVGEFITAAHLVVSGS